MAGSSGAAATITLWQAEGGQYNQPGMATMPGEPIVLPFWEGARYYRGCFDVPSAGTLVVELTSPRPLRLWFGNVLVLDECLNRFSFHREMHGVVLIPCEAGKTEFRAEAGQRPAHPQFVDESCPSRNRQEVMGRLAGQLPDRLLLHAWVAEGVHCPAASLRYLPTQFAEDGVVYQHVLARQADWSLNGPPSIDLWSTADRAAPELAMCLAGGETVRCGASAREHGAGIKRFYVPVGAVGYPAPPRRTAATDNRIEPVLETVGSLDVAVDGEGGVVWLTIPVYERLGRNAPVQEYSTACWPEYEQARHRLPVPVLPEEMARFGTLYDEAWQMLFRLVRHPVKESGNRNPYIATCTHFTHSQFVWDTCFTTMAVAYGCRALPAYDTINLLYAAQHDGGYIHRETDTRDGMPILYEPDFSPNPPLLSVAEWQMALVTGDTARLKAVYPLLVGYHEWLRQHRRLPDGTYWTTGLANGLDNSPSLGDGYPCLTAQMAHDAETLGRIASAIGNGSDAAAWQREHEETTQAINDLLWDEKTAFYSTSLPDGGHNPNKVVTGFWPLWSGAVPQGRVEALARHLKEPKSFWRTHPVPSLAADSEHFVPGGQYWLGSTWAPTNYMVVQGFERCGRHGLALETALRHLDCMSAVYRDTGFIWENYCSEELKRGSWSMHDYCWSALAPVALLIEIVLGIRLDAIHHRIVWTLPPYDDIGIRDLPFGHGTVSLIKTERYGQRGIQVETEEAFLLVLANENMQIDIRHGGFYSTPSPHQTPPSKLIYNT